MLVRLLSIGDIGVSDGMMHIGDEAMFEALRDEMLARGVELVAVSSEPAESADRYGIAAVSRVGFAGLSRDALQQLVRRDEDRGAEVVVAGVARGDDLRDAVDENVRIPDGRHAVLRVTTHLDPDGAIGVLILDRAKTLALRDGEERPLHHLRMVLRRVIDQIRDEKVAYRMRVGSR